MTETELKEAYKHAQYLVYTLVPDLHDMGLTYTARDVRTAAEYIEKLAHSQLATEVTQ